MIRTLLQKPGTPWLLLACSLVAVLALVLTRGGPQEAKAPKAPAKGQATAAAPVPAAAAAALPDAEWQSLNLKVVRSPAADFAAADADGGAVAAEYARLFVWDLDLRRQLNPGDEMAVAWRWTEEEDIEIGVARLEAKKAGKSLRAYRFQAPGDAFISYWKEDGTEVPHRLIDSPLDAYEQITSLLKDRPTHKGMDFKTAVGTPVKTPRAGVVLRSNWNWTGNGNCVEVQFEDGTLAKFLHLSENRVKPGEKVTAGQVIALSGNTGRSTAPHLHYQLNQGAKVIDPIEYHGTTRRKLEGAALTAFQATVPRLDALIAARTAGL